MSADAFDTDPFAARPHPLMWAGIEDADVLAPAHDGEGAAEAALAILTLPPAIARFKRTHLADGDENARAEARAFLISAQAALEAAGRGEANTLLPVDALSSDTILLLDDAMGEGEATILIAGPIEYQIQETLFPGLWDVRTFSADGAALSRHYEVGPTPLVVEAAARDLTADRFVMPTPDSDTAAGLMNVMPLLAEIAARMTDVRPGQANHVVSLTNLPMTDGDLALLGSTIGGGEIRAHSKGYGATRVTSTRARGVWQVEYLNSMGTVILDTMEIGGPPAALLAAREDFEDSAVRIGELLEIS